jgi:hypothetical protein
VEVLANCHPFRFVAGAYEAPADEIDKRSAMSKSVMSNPNATEPGHGLADRKCVEATRACHVVAVQRLNSCWALTASSSKTS